jgi:hypothetical protein
LSKCTELRIVLGSWKVEDAKSAKIIAKMNSKGLLCGLCAFAVPKELK